MIVVKKLRDFLTTAPVYKIKCFSCGTSFEFLASDLSSSKIAGFPFIKCPCCSSVLYLDSRNKVYKMRGRTWKI